MEIGKRNTSIDFFRGIAMMLVVLGHTISGAVTEYQSSVLFNIIWTLQMPLFMLISGYVTKFGKRMDTCSSLGRYMIKRTISYLFPWLVWTFLVRGLLINGIQGGWYFNLKYLFWNMDAGYWFLTSLWTISVLFGVSEFLAIKCNGKNREVLGVFFTVLFMVVLSGGLLMLGLWQGISFFGIKLTLYYIPFFMLGYLFSVVQPKLLQSGKYNALKEAVIAMAFLLYVVLILNYNFYGIDDDVKGIVLRVIASTCGCVTVFGMFNFVQVKADNAITDKVVWIGQNSLGIYLAHLLFLNLIKIGYVPTVYSFDGFVTVSVNYFITVFVTASFVWLINKNKYTKMLLLGK